GPRRCRPAGAGRAGPAAARRAGVAVARRAGLAAGRDLRVAGAEPRHPRPARTASQARSRRLTAHQASPAQHPPSHCYASLCGRCQTCSARALMHAPDDHAAPPRHILTPSTLNRLVRGLLEDALSLVWIEGELSNVARPASGHLYFTLKDSGAQVRCAMFRPKNAALRFKPADGMQVLLRARVGLYEPRGEFQLVAESMEPAGEGALQRAFEQLKAKLDAEGLFDPARKRPLPRYARRIGVITSATGAAIRDVLSVLSRRWPLAEVEVLPVPVQGREAPPAIVAMLDKASRAARHDVLLVTRGGGSLEDLWAFNDEAVARAIHACAIPVVSAVGHEVDFSIADFVADLRAPTPSAAAELLVPDAQTTLRHLRH